MTSPLEVPVQLGIRRTLLGVLTVPATLTTEDPCILVVLLNAGIVHRVGPGRLHVQLARQLAREGHAALRFDLSGIGDSERRDDGLPPLDAAMADIREVVDEMAQMYPRATIMLAGLCSGADHAMLYAGQDDRVRGAILLDPNIPRTRGYYLRYYYRRAINLRSWLNVISGRHPVWKRWSRRLRAARAAAPVAVDTPTGQRERALDDADVRSFLATAYGRVASRRIPLLGVFTDGVPSQHCYRKQILDAFPGGGLARVLSLEYFRDVDHTFEAGSSRARLFARILTWLRTAEFT